MCLGLLNHSTSRSEPDMMVDSKDIVNQNDYFVHRNLYCVMRLK